MEASPIDLVPLRRALATLGEALDFWAREPVESPLKRHLRSSVIQSFEFVYELSIRVLRRALLERSATAERVGDLSFSDLLRAGADAGLLADPIRWRDWRAMRNATSHAYDEPKAEAVAVRVPEFAIEARRLLETLEAAVSVDDTADGRDRSGVTPDQWRDLTAILDVVLPGAEVRLFGSRATGRARPFSDLDLMIVRPGALDGSHNTPNCVTASR